MIKRSKCSSPGRSGRIIFSVHPRGGYDCARTREGLGLKQGIIVGIA